MAQPDRPRMTTQCCVEMLQFACRITKEQIQTHARTHTHTHIVSIVKPTRCTIFEFIECHFTCFGPSFRPSSGVRETVHTASGICHTD